MLISVIQSQHNLKIFDLNDLVEEADKVVFLSGLFGSNPTKETEERILYLVYLKKEHFSKFHFVAGPDEFQYKFMPEFQQHNFNNRMSGRMLELMSRFSEIFVTNVTINKLNFSYYSTDENRTFNSITGEGFFSDSVNAVKSSNRITYDEHNPIRRIKVY